VSPLKTPRSTGVPFNVAARVPSYPFDCAEIPPTITGFASIVPVSVGCVSRYFEASAPLNVYPPTNTVLLVPTAALRKFASGTPPTCTTSPPVTPTRVGVPVIVASRVPSYTRLVTLSPWIVNSFSVKFAASILPLRVNASRL
jgi:hypothetical protein